MSAHATSRWQLTAHSYFDCEDLSDVTIELKGKSIKAHRLILAQGADYFKNLFSVKCEVSLSLNLITCLVPLTSRTGRLDDYYPPPG